MNSPQTEIRAVSTQRSALVTGAGGMSGAAVVDALLAAGWRVVALTSPRGDGRMTGRPFPGEALTVAPWDLAAGASPPLTVSELIVHTAARSPGPGASVAEMARVNAVGSAVVADFARRCGARTVVNFSSLSVYGDIGLAVADENTEVRNPDVYGQTKMLGEAALNEAAGAFRVLSLRLPGVLGPGAARNWLTRVWAAARRGETISIVNPDGAFNNAVHVADLAAWIVRLADAEWSGADAVTLGAGGSVTIRRAAELLIAGAGGRSGLEVKAAAKPGFIISSRRAADLYGYAPMDIETMLRRYVNENLH